MCNGKGNVPFLLILQVPRNPQWSQRSCRDAQREIPIRISDACRSREGKEGKTYKEFPEREGSMLFFDLPLFGAMYIHVLDLQFSRSLFDTPPPCGSYVLYLFVPVCSRVNLPPTPANVIDVVFLQTYVCLICQLHLSPGDLVIIRKNHLDLLKFLQIYLELEHFHSVHLELHNSKQTNWVDPELQKYHVSHLKSFNFTVPITMLLPNPHWNLLGGSSIIWIYEKSSTPHTKNRKYLFMSSLVKRSKL